MRRILPLALLVALALPFTAQRAEAQFAFIPYVGYNLDFEKLLVGVGTEFDLPIEAPFGLSIRPAIEYVFTDSEKDTFGGTTISASTTFLQINGDAIARFGTSPSLSPYAGAGLAILYSSYSLDCSGSGCEFFPEESGSDTTVGLNLLGGVEFTDALGFGSPFVQGRFTMKDGSQFSILAGVALSL